MKRKLSILAVILTVALSVVRAASAQWVFMGVPGEGVSSLVVTGTTILAGTYYSSVYRSDDSGENWKELGSGLGPYPVVYSLCAIDTTFFAGTGEGVFRSTEHDTGWQLVSAKAMVISLSPMPLPQAVPLCSLERLMAHSFRPTSAIVGFPGIAI